jgi:hypothetical protein
MVMQAVRTLELPIPGQFNGAARLGKIIYLFWQMLCPCV